MELMQGLLTRRSVRAYTGKKVSEEQMTDIVRAGMFAPSARNQQAWEFVMTNDKDALERIAQAVPTAKMAAGAAFAIAVCVDESRLTSPDYFIQDCSAAVENMLLAAHAKGFGAVWVGMYPKEEREQAVRDVFDIPEKVPVAALVVGGVPSETLPLVDRFRSESLHIGKW